MDWETILEAALQYYGFDWLGMCLMFTSLWWIGDKNKFGFIIGALGSLSWTIFGILSGSIPAIIGNALFVGVYMRGLYKWRAK